MHDLYSLSQIIKALPIYTIHRDVIHDLFRRLRNQNNVTTAALMQAFDNEFPDWGKTLRDNEVLYKKHEQETQSYRELGYRFVTYGEELYPEACYLMQEPPLTLSYLGEPAWRQGPSLAVVGSREPAEMSILWMEKEFAHFCEENQVCIVSGGARGVDQKAHSLALRKNNPTIVVLPSGLSQIYPQSLKEWIKPVLQGGGCFLSEYAPQQTMHKYLFHHRNRLIAALGQGVLLVEARRRSGTLITAQQALQLGRSVAVVPGHPLDPHFGGSLEMLSDGAILVRDAQDLTMFLGAETLLKNDPGVGLVGHFKTPH